MMRLFDSESESCSPSAECGANLHASTLPYLALNCDYQQQHQDHRTDIIDNIGGWPDGRSSYIKLISPIPCCSHIRRNELSIPNHEHSVPPTMSTSSYIRRMVNPSIVLYGAKNAKMEDKPVPELLDPHDVLVRIAYVGVCGSDVSIPSILSPILIFNISYRSISGTMAA
jgi:hypothetical protein